jgi:hypothetical protein
MDSGIDADLKRFGQLCRQNFWPDDHASREKHLSRNLAITMLGLRVARIAGFILLIGVGAWFGLYAFGESKNEAMHILPDIINGKRAELSKLLETRAYLIKWDSALTPRSQAWSVMDFVLGLLPQSDHLVCDKMLYEMKENQGRTGFGRSGANTGFVREWVLEGTCDESEAEALSRLQEPSTLKQIFDSTAERLGDPSFAVSGQRTASAELREEVKPNAKPGDLSLQFRLLVTQNFPDNDVLALSAPSKAPAKPGIRP